MSGFSHFTQRIFSAPERLVGLLENAPIPPASIPFIILLWSLLRIKLEYVLLNCRTCPSHPVPWTMYTHGALSFFFAYTSGTLILLCTVKEEPLKIMRVTAFGLALIILPPVVDGLIFHRDTIYHYVWYGAGGWEIYPLPRLLFHFHGDYFAGPGLKAEIWAVSILSSAYVLVKRKNPLKAILVMVLTMCIFVVVAYQLVIATGFSRENYIAKTLQLMKQKGKFGFLDLSSYWWGMSFGLLALLTAWMARALKGLRFAFAITFFIIMASPSLYAVFRADPLGKEEYVKGLIFSKFAVTTSFLPVLWALLERKSMGSSLKKMSGLSLLFIVFLLLASFMLYYGMPYYYVILSIAFTGITITLSAFKKGDFISVSFLLLVALFNWLWAVFKLV